MSKDSGETGGEAVRLQKVLSSWGLASRRTIEQWMLAGRITVDGVIADTLGLKVVPDACTICLDGRVVTPPEPDGHGHLVLAFHKPVGVITSLKDPRGRKTICDFLDPNLPRVYPIGRLDYDSSGLLLLTNDGELTNRLLHPRFKVEKEYVARIADLELSVQDLEAFRSGLELDDGRTLPCRITAAGNGRYHVVLREGRKRQVRRMFAVLHRKVISLHRIRFGSVVIGDLAPGAVRPLSAAETAALREGPQEP